MHQSTVSQAVKDSHFGLYELGLVKFPQVVIPLCAAVDCRRIYSLLCGACKQDELPSFSSLATLTCPTLKQRFTFSFPLTSNLYSVLDVAKVV